MKTLTVTVPDDVARHLDQLGLLNSECSAAWEAVFRDALQRYPAAGRASREEASQPVREEAPIAMTVQTEPPGAPGERPSGDRGEGEWIEEAVRELESLDEEIAEDDLPPVAEVARTAARQLLEALAGGPIAPIIAPTEDGEVSLYFKAPRTLAALCILLDSEGSGTWYSVIPGKEGYGRYANSGELPLDFLRSRLKALASDSP